MLDAIDYDAIRGMGRYCYSPQPTEGWSVINPNAASGGPSTWAKHAFDYWDNNPVPVDSFTFSDTEATSVVRLGSHYTLTQHWHPWDVDPRVFQLDVTIKPILLPVFGAEPLIYRQIVPLNIDAYADRVDLVKGTGDGVSDATTNLYVPGGADQGPDTIDNPLVPLPANDCDEADCRGFALDITVDSLSMATMPITPQFSMFYGFADTTSQAASLLDTAGATTHAIAPATGWDADWNEVSFALLVGLHQNTG